MSHKTIIILDPSTASPFNGGRFQGWGTSLCWWANRLGYSETLTRQAARAFFSENGLRLDIARYNLGGGDNPSHRHILRSDSQVPGVWSSFDPATGEVTGWDLSRDQRQLNVAKAALAENPRLVFEGFSNSPPYFMTVSGCTGGGDPADRDNLRPDRVEAFAKFIAGAAGRFAKEGVAFMSYSPMNEPDTGYWHANSEKQEGCHFSPGESQSRMLTETRKALDAAGLSHVMVAGMDETSLDQTAANFAMLTDEGKAALGRIDTHTYQGTDRAGVKAAAEDAGKSLWMSEVDGDWDGFELGERIISDMNGMQPSAWVIWNVVDMHKDGRFTAPDGTRPEAGRSFDPAAPIWGLAMADHDAGRLLLSDKYYFWGQFTRYIRPGDTLIASSPSTLAAYNRDSGDIKIVAVNPSGEDRAYVFDLSAFGTVGRHVRAVRTNNLAGPGAERWKELTAGPGPDGRQLSVTAKAGTVTTFIVD